MSLAIGKRGQNARLTSKLTGWQVDIDAERVAHFGFEEQVAKAVGNLASIPGITPDQATALVHYGHTSLEELLQIEAGDLAEITGIGDQAQGIVDAARAEAARRTLKIGENQAQ